MAEKLQQRSNIVEEFKIENTRVKICDDYCCGCTQEEIEKTLKRIAAKTYHELVATTAINIHTI